MGYLRQLALAAHRFVAWFLKASLTILGVIVLLGEANRAIPELRDRAEDFGWGPILDAVASWIERTCSFVYRLVTEHFILLLILLAGYGVAHHIFVGIPTHNSKDKFNQRRGKRQPSLRKGQKK